MLHIQVSFILLNQIRWLYFYMESLLTGSFRFEGKSVHLMGRWYGWGILLTNVWAYSKMDFTADLMPLLKWLNIPTPNLLFFQYNARALILTPVESTLFPLEDGHQESMEWRALQWRAGVISLSQCYLCHAGASTQTAQQKYLWIFSKSSGPVSCLDQWVSNFIMTIIPWSTY